MISFCYLITTVSGGVKLSKYGGLKMFMPPLT